MAWGMVPPGAFDHSVAGKQGFGKGCNPAWPDSS